jgi:subtilisin family serine protease
MQNDRRIIYAEPNFRTGSPEGDLRHRARPGGEPSAPSSDPGPYTSQYAIENLNLPAAHERARGAGSVVAVIDTGVQPSHRELRGSLTLARYDFIGDDSVPADTGNGRDDDGEVDEMVGHGTHVAGIGCRVSSPRGRVSPAQTKEGTDVE